MTKNSVKTKDKQASLAGKELAKNPKQLIRKLAAGNLVNAKEDSKSKKTRK